MEVNALCMYFQNALNHAKHGSTFWLEKRLVLFSNINKVLKFRNADGICQWYSFQNPLCWVYFLWKSTTVWALWAYVSLILPSVIQLETEQLRGNLEKCLTSHFLPSTEDGHTLSLMLLNLLDNAESKVQLRSAEYLFDIFSTESILVADLAHCYLVSDETANSSTCKEMVSLGTWQDEKKMLWNIGKKKAAEREELVEVLQRLADYCVIQDNKFLPDPVHQNIAYSCGMHKFHHNYCIQHCHSIQAFK